MHGSKLTIQDLKWFVTEQRLAKKLLGSPVLESLSLKTRDVLPAVADRFAGSTDADLLVGTFAKESDGSLYWVIEGVLYQEGGENYNMMETRTKNGAT